MRALICFVLAATGGVVASTRLAQTQAAAQEGAAQQQNYQTMTPEQRTEATRVFLGLGAAPDKAAAERGAPVFARHCAFCHGVRARGATGPSLITSDVVLKDDHGEHLLPFLKKGVVDKGMPAFASMSDRELTNVAEYLHLQVEDVANRGGYHVLNIVVGDAAKGKEYVSGHCMSCHNMETFAHIAGKFRSPEQLQRYWIWPAGGRSIKAKVKTPEGMISGRVTEMSDFKITVVDESGSMHTVERGAGVEVEVEDPLAAHQRLVMTLGNDAMHNVTAYLETLQ